MKIKRGNRANNKGEAEMPNEDKSYEEITVTDKAAYFEENSPFVMELSEEVECIHCGERFVLSEFKVVREKRRKGNEYIVCKYFPGCSGTIIDFISMRDSDE